MVITKDAREYATVNSGKRLEYCNQEDYQIQWGQIDDYELREQIGIGKYSQVFIGLNRKSERKCAVKQLIWTVDVDAIKKEIKILDSLRDGTNIIKLLDVVRSTEHPMSPVVSLIFEFIEQADFQFLYNSFTINDIRYYIYELLKALDFCHSMGIMHRDVKPDNVIFNRHTKKLRLIDFGMAEFYVPQRKYSVKVATRSYKAPELLIDYPFYNYSIDLWSVGCILGQLLSKKDYLFDNNKNNEEQLCAIIKILGSHNFHTYLKKYEIRIKDDFQKLTYIQTSWHSFIKSTNQELISNQGIDLLNDLLCFDHIKRLTAREAMDHSFFAPLFHSDSSNSDYNSN